MKLRQNKLVPLVLEDVGLAGSNSSSVCRSQDELDSLIGRLETIRQRWASESRVEFIPQVLLHLPEALLREYSDRRHESHLGEIFSIANQFQSQADRVVFVGSADALRIVRAYLEACCDPFWNELTRGERGSKPRVYFSGDTLDNDLTQGLLHLISSSRPANRAEPLAWGVVELSTSYRIKEGGIVESHLKQQLRVSGHDCLYHVCLPKNGFDRRLSGDIPSAMLPFSSIGMLPAAILGINIMELLAGAATATRLFFETEASLNPILRWVAWNYPKDRRAIAIWNQSLNAASQWLEHLGTAAGLELNRSNKVRRFIYPLRDGISQDSTHELNHIRVLNSRFDSLVSDPTPLQEIVWDPRSDRPKRMDALPVDSVSLNQFTERLYLRSINDQTQWGEPGATLHLADLGELSLGQWMQWMIIATLLEAQLEQGTSSHSS